MSSTPQPAKLHTPERTPGLSAAASRRASQVGVMTSIGAVPLLLFALVHFSLGTKWIGVVAGGIVLCAILNLVLMRYSGDVDGGASALLALALVAIVMVWYGGGADSAGYWLCIVPPMAYQLKGVKRARWWAALIVAGVAMAAVARLLGLLMTPTSSSALATLAVSLLALAAISDSAYRFVDKMQEKLRLEMTEHAQNKQRAIEESGARRAAEDQLSSLREQLGFMAHHDPLTGLPNRTLFFDRLQHTLALAQRARTDVAVVLLDLDDFNDINKNMGYGVGDEVLRTVSERLRAALRRSDTVAHLSADRFAVILQGIAGRHCATAVADDLITAVSRPTEVLGEDRLLSASAGVSVYPADSEDPDVLIATAETDLQREKLARREHPIYHAH